MRTRDKAYDSPPLGLYLLLLNVLVFFGGVVFFGRMASGAVTPYTPSTQLVADLPTCTSSIKGRLRSVTDASSPTSCATGGGANAVVCYCDGSTWQAIGTGGGSGDITDVFDCSTGNCSAITASAGDSLDFAAADFLELPQATTCPTAACDAAGEAGRICYDTDATTGLRFYGCEGAGGWVLQGDGGGGGGGDNITVNASAATDANFIDGDVDFTLDTGPTPDTIAATVACTGCVDITDLASDAVGEPELKAVDAAADEECLTFETTTGDFEWQACASSSGQEGRAADTTDVGNVGTGEDNLITEDVTAGALGANGDTLNVWAYGTTAANANDKRIRCYFGATVLIDTGTSTLNGQEWSVEGSVTRTGAATQEARASIHVAGAGQWTVNFSEPAETLSGAVTVKCTGEATSNNDVVQEGLVLAWNVGGGGGGGGGTPSFADDFSNRVRVYSDLGNADAGDDAVIISGTGADANCQDITGLDPHLHPGIISCDTGSTASGTAGVRWPDQNGFKVDGASSITFWAVVYVDTLSTSSERYDAMAGLSGSDDALYLRYSDDRSSGAWECVATEDGTTTATSTGVTVAINTWYSLKVVVNTSTPSVTCTVNGAGSTTVTTNIPDLNDPLALYVAILKRVGASALTLRMDMVALEYVMGSARF